MNRIAQSTARKARIKLLLLHSSLQHFLPSVVVFCLGCGLGCAYAAHPTFALSTPCIIAADSSAYVKLTSTIHALARDVEQAFISDKRTALFAVHTVADGKNVRLKGETTIPAAKQEFLKRLKEARIENITDDIEILLARTLGEKTWGIVGVAVCNLRTKPAHAAELASQGLLGYPVRVLRKLDNGWVQVQTPDDYIAWVDQDAIVQTTEAVLKTWTGAPKILVTAEFAFALQRPDRTAQRVADVSSGNVLKLLDKTDGFYRVEFPDGQVAFLPLSDGIEWNVWMQAAKAFLTPPDEVIATSRLYMGVPYLWGGTSVRGLDCSGFTRTVFLRHGIFLPRDASQQAFIGEAVETNGSAPGSYPAGYTNLRTGDLLFFGKRATDSTKESVTHVGIYIGNGEYIHEAGRVRLNSFDPKAPHYSEPRAAAFLRARRILGIKPDGVKTVAEIFTR